MHIQSRRATPAGRTGYQLASVAVALALLLTGASCGGSSAPSGAPAPATATPTTAPSGPWVIAWSDELDGSRGARVDALKWVTETGGSGWGNNELQYYTDRAANAFTNGDGVLVIQAQAERYTGPDGIMRDYTSARLKTAGRFEQTHGKFEARLKIPRGQGIWPAFWMLGSDIGSVGWPACGEIDVMENIGREPSRVWGSMHGPGFSGGQAKNAPYDLPSGTTLADDFHVFAVEWEPSVIRWYVDGNLYQTRTRADLVATQLWVFEHAFFMLLNVAVGGAWPGNPDATTVFPQTMEIDYVRVYRRGS